MSFKHSYVLALTIAALIGSSIPARAAVTHNLPAGQYMLDAQGGGSESLENYDDGHFDIVGLVTLNATGHASSINLTLAYQDYDEVNDGFTCNLIIASDLLYSVNTANGVGTLTLTVQQGDTCVIGDNSGFTSEVGKSISFNLYVANGQARVVSTGSNFASPTEPGEVLDSPSVAGTLIPSTLFAGAPAGPMLIDGTGAATDTRQYFGFAHMSIAGFANLNGKGSASGLDVTLVYSDDNYGIDGLTCHLNTPGDLKYSPSGGAYKLRLTVSKNDSCYQTANPATPVPNTGNSIEFNYYVGGPQSKIVSFFSNLVDGTGDVITDPGLVASLTPGSTSNKWPSGTYMLLAQGGDAEPNEDGSMELAGTVTMNGTSATALDVTLSYQDWNEPDDGFYCRLTTPTDVTYSPFSSSGPATLTLTVGAGDPPCSNGDTSGPASETGYSITFALYASGNQARIASTASDFVSPAEGETLEAPSVAGSFTPAVSTPLSGQSLIEGIGHTTDTEGNANSNDNIYNTGHIALGGIANLNGTGGATSLDLTLAYSDSYSDADAMICRFTTPSDLTYALSGKVGTMVLTVGPNDTCYNTPTGIPIPNAGRSITFAYYAGYTQSEIISLQSNLLDGNGDTISDVGLTAIVAPQGH